MIEFLQLLSGRCLFKMCAFLVLQKKMYFIVGFIPFAAIHMSQ